VCVRAFLSLLLYSLTSPPPYSFNKLRTLWGGVIGQRGHTFLPHTTYPHSTPSTTPPSLSTISTPHLHISIYAWLLLGFACQDLRAHDIAGESIGTQRGERALDFQVKEIIPLLHYSSPLTLFVYRSHNCKHIVYTMMNASDVKSHYPHWVIVPFPLTLFITDTYSPHSPAHPR
jgi:hypothetical protein